MRTRRWLRIALGLISGLVVGLGVLVVVFLFALDDEDYKALLVWAVNNHSDYRLSIHGDFSFNPALVPSLSAHQVSLDSGPGDLRLRAGAVQLQLELKPLLQRILWVKRLALQDVALTIQAVPEKPGVAAEKTGLGIGRSGPPVLPLIEDLDIRALSLSYGAQGAKTVQVTLDALSLEQVRGDPRRLEIQGQGAFAGMEYRIEGSMGKLAGLLESREPFPARIRLISDQAAFAAEGTLEQTPSGPSLSFDVHGELEEPAGVLALFGVQTPELGRFEGSATLAGSWDRLRAEKITLNLARESSVSVNAQGTVGNLWTSEGVDMTLSGQVQDTDLIAWLVPEALLLPDLDRLNVAGRFGLSKGMLVVTDFSANGAQGEGFQTEFAGDARISGLELPGDFEHMDLYIRFSSPTTKEAQPFVFDFLPELGPVSGEGRMTARSGDFTLEGVDIRAGTAKSMTVEIKGRVDEITFVPGEHEDSEFDIVIKANRTERIAHLFGIQLPEVGPVTISGRLSGSDQKSRLQGLKLRAGRSDRLTFEAAGNLGFGDFSTDQWLDAVDLQVEGSSRDTGAVATLIGQDLLELGPVRTRFHLEGRGKELRMSKIEGSIGRAETLLISASGNVGRVLLEPELAFKTIDLRVDASAPSTSALEPLAGRALPDLGELRLTARLSDENGGLGLKSGKLRVGSEERPVITGTGRIGDLLTTKDFSWKLRIEIGSNDLADIVGYPLPDLGVLRGSLQLSDADGSLGIETIEIVSEAPDLLTVRLSGAFDDFLGGDQLDVQAELSARDLALIGELFNQQWPAGGRTKASGRLQGGRKKLRFDGTLDIGSTRFTGKVTGSLAGRRPKFTGKIHTPKLFLADIGIMPRTTPTANVSRKRKRSAHLFSREPLPLAWVQQFDLELDVGADEIVGIDLTIDSLVALVSIENGELAINPLTLDFERGVVLVDLAVNTGPEPWAALQVSADDVEMENALAQIQDKVPIKGSLNVFIDLRGEGRSPHEIASSLGGDFGIAVENVTVPRRQLDLFTADFLGWAVSSSVSGEREGEIHCGIVRFSIRNGMAESQILVADGPNFTLTGRGNLNLGDETLDFVLVPRTKRRFQVSADPVKISGSLTDPAVNALPTRSAATAAAAAIAPLIIVPALTGGYLWNLLSEADDEHSPCLDLKAPGLQPPSPRN